MKTSASSAQTSTRDVFCDALACGDDADIFILLFHHTQCLCGFVTELDIGGRNDWKSINIRELTWKTCPRVSETSIFAVLWFKIDQRLLIITVVPLSIPGMSSKIWLPSTRTPAVIIQYHSFRKEVSSADDEWSGSSTCRCFYASKWDGIATRLYQLQVENFTCMLYSRKDTTVNDAHLQTLLPKTLIQLPLPPCQAGMNQKLKRVNLMALKWKYAHLDIT